MPSPVHNKSYPLPANSGQNVKILGRMTMTSARIFYQCFAVVLTLHLISLPNAVVSSENIFEEIPGPDLCPDPIMWHCEIDSQGKFELACAEWGMSTIPNNFMNSTVQIIRIVPPLGKANSLTIGLVFRTFTKLEELHIVRSQIPSIDDAPFWGLNSLRVLNLASNNISTIAGTNFAGLFSLDSLNLSENGIETLEPASFHSLSALKSLDLSKNRISKLALVKPLFCNLTKLEALNLSENPVRELHPDVFQYVLRLKELKCRKCGIKNINPLLYALLPDIKILDLGENELKYLNREEYFNLIHLEELYLDGNQVSVLTDETFRSVHLRVLTLASNRILRLYPRAFFNSSIADLNLSNNKFENLPLETFESQGQLEFLNLSGNGLTEIFPQQLSHLLRLRGLDLSKNRLKGLRTDVLDRLGELPLDQLSLGGNPWACDGCHILPLLQRGVGNPLFRQGCDSPEDSDCLRCTSPEALHGEALLKLDEENLELCAEEGE